MAAKGNRIKIRLVSDEGTGYFYVTTKNKRTMGEKLRMNVPFHFINEESCPGVKDHGGIIQHNMNDIEIEESPDSEGEPEEFEE